ALRGAVVGRAALDDVADVDRAARDPEPLLDHLREQLAGAADEGQALLVLGLARALADEQELGVRVAVAEDDVRAALGEAAAVAVAKRRPYLVEVGAPGEGAGLEQRRLRGRRLRNRDGGGGDRGGGEHRGCGALGSRRPRGARRHLEALLG